jgi:hypothetical protein
MMRFLAAFAASSFLVACSGAFAGTPPARPVISTVSHKTSVSLRLKIPRKEPASLKHRHGKHPQFLSPSIVSAKVWVASQSSGTWTADPGYPEILNLTTGSPNCMTTASATSCSFTFSNIPIGVPMGVDFDFYDGPNATGDLIGASDQGGGVTCQTTPCYTALMIPREGANNVVGVTIDGVVALIDVAQAVPMVEGVPSTQTLTVAPMDADGNIILDPGSFTGPTGSPFVVQIEAINPSGPYAITGSGPDCPTGNLATGSNCVWTLAYDGGIIRPPEPDVNGIGNDGFTISEQGVGAVLRFYPVFEPVQILNGIVTTTFASATSPSQNISTSVPSSFGTSNGTSNGLLESDECSGIAAVTNSVSSITIAPIANGACVVSLSLVSRTGLNAARELQQIPVSVGGSPNTEPAYQISPSPLLFSGVDAPASPITIAQFGPATLSGVASLGYNACSNPGPLYFPISFIGSLVWENLDEGFAQPVDMPTLIGNQSAPISITPPQAGTCELLAQAAGIAVSPPVPPGDAYYFTVGW